MVFIELNEAIYNIGTTDDCDRYFVFDTIYSFISSKGLLCFDSEGKVLGLKGDVIIKMTLDYHTNEFPFPERCWWLRRYLYMYEECFCGIVRDKNQPGPLEFSTPEPKRNWNYPDIT